MPALLALAHGGEQAVEGPGLAAHDAAQPGRDREKDRRGEPESCRGPEGVVQPFGRKELFSAPFVFDGVVLVGSDAGKPVLHEAQQFLVALAHRPVELAGIEHEGQAEVAGQAELVEIIKSRGPVHAKDLDLAFPGGAYHGLVVLERKQRPDALRGQARDAGVALFDAHGEPAKRGGVADAAEVFMHEDRDFYCGVRL